MANRLDLNIAATTIRRFITGKLLESGLSGYVIGLSGGVDSALVASLAVKAVGSEKVFGLILPYRTSTPDSVQHASLLANKLGIQTRALDISPMLDAFFGTSESVDRVRLGNKAARERMSILFDAAHERSALVLGTSNRTEICLGYTTWFGDSAASVNPIAELYKGEVLAMAELLEIPAEILRKKPSADLWPGQTDEDEIGVSYRQIDRILSRIIDEGECSMAAMSAEGIDTIELSRVVSLVNRNAFKRSMPAIAPLGRTAVPQKIQLQA